MSARDELKYILAIAGGMALVVIVWIWLFGG